MSRIRSKNTKPELIVRSFLHKKVFCSLTKIYWYGQSPVVLAIFFIPLLLISNVSIAQHPLRMAFVIDEGDLIPEGIAFDVSKSNFYIGSIAKKKIIRIDEKGQVHDFISTGRDSLGEVLGMTVNPRTRTLWVCNNSPDSPAYSAVHVFDLESAALVKKYLLPHNNQPHLFNDLCILQNDDVFITDIEGSSLFQIKKGSDTLVPFIQPGGITYPNGITTSGDPGILYVATSTVQGIVAVNLVSKEIRPLPTENLYPGILDGLYYSDHSLIGIQNVFFPEMICRYRLNEKGDSISSMMVLAEDHPQFSVPTTGVISGDWFYFIANSNVNLYENGVIRSRERLGKVYIMKLKIK